MHILKMVLPRPEELRQIEGLEIVGYMQPADEVGGDYYDVFSVPNTFAHETHKMPRKKRKKRFFISCAFVYFVVIDDVTRHIGSQEIYDDLTLVILKK